MAIKFEDLNHPFGLPDKPANKTSALRKAGDLAVGIGSGAVGATKALSDVFGADNAASKALGGVNEGLQGLLSPETVVRQYQQGRIMDEAKGQGIGGQVAAGLKAFAVDPAQTIAQGAGSIAPFIAAQFVPGVGQSATAARALQFGMGAGMGAGTAKGAIFDEVKKRELAAGRTPEQAQAAADAAQAYGGANTDQIALGAGLGLADAAFGATPAAVSALRRSLGKEAVEGIGKPTTDGIIKAGIKGAAGEMPVEFAQGAQEQVAANIAAQRAGYDAGTWDGAIAQGTLESLAAAGPGAGFGILNRGQAPAAAQPPEQPPVAPGTTPGTTPGAPPAATQPAGQTLGQSLTGTPMADLMGGGGLTGGANPLQAGLSTLTSNNQIYPGMNTEPTGYTVDPETGAIIPAEPVGVRQMAGTAAQVEAPAPVAQAPVAPVPAPPALGESLTGTPVADMLDTSTPSQRMGLNPEAGGLTAAAAIAVDSGASPVTIGMGLRALSGLTEVTPIERTAGQIGTPRRLGESPIIDVQAREVSDPELQGQQSRIGMTPRIGFDQPQGAIANATQAAKTQQAAPQQQGAPAAIGGVQGGANAMPVAEGLGASSAPAVQGGPIPAVQVQQGVASQVTAGSKPSKADNLAALQQKLAGQTKPTPTTPPAPNQQATTTASDAGSVRPDGWRTNRVQLASVAKSLGIDTKGMSASGIAAEVDRIDAGGKVGEGERQYRIGQDGKSIDSDGAKPFANYTQARRYYDLAYPKTIGMQIVPHRGGYALAKQINTPKDREIAALTEEDDGGISWSDDAYIPDGMEEHKHVTLQRAAKQDGGWTVDYEKINDIQDEDMPSVVRKQGFIYRGLNNQEKQIVFNKDGSITLLPGKNFDSQTTGVSMTPYKEVAIDYATRTENAKTRQSDGAILKISRKFQDGDLTNEGDHELAWYGGELTIKDGEWELIENPAKTKATPAPEAVPTNQGATNGQGQETLLKAEQPTGAAAMVSGAPVAAGNAGNTGNANTALEDGSPEDYKGHFIYSTPMTNGMFVARKRVGKKDLGEAVGRIHATKADARAAIDAVVSAKKPSDTTKPGGFTEKVRKAAKRNKPKTIEEADDAVKMTGIAGDVFGGIREEAAQQANNAKKAEWATQFTTPSDRLAASDISRYDGEKLSQVVDSGRVTLDRANEMVDSAVSSGWMVKDQADRLKRMIAPVAPVQNAEQAPSKYTAVGKNQDGKDLVQDARGVRSYVESGIRISEPVRLRTEKDGVATDVVNRRDEFKTVDELGQQDENDPEMQAYESGLNAETRAADKNKVANVGDKPVAKPASTAPAAAAPAAAYGASNTLVKPDRAAEIRAKLKAKLNQLNSGIDPELLALGAELAVFHIEAGVRKFADFAKTIASDLDVPVSKVRPYLRSWYNGARDMMEDAKISIEGMDSPDQVRDALAKLDESPAQAPTTPENKNATPDEPDQKALENLPAKNDGEPEGRGEAGASPASGSEPGSKPDSGADGKRVSAARGGRGGSGRVSNPEAGAARVRRPRGTGADGAGAGVPEADGGLNTPETTSAPNIPATNFAITPDLNLGVGGEVAKFNDNMSAIKTLKALEGERRRATPDEQRVLARFVGWGGLANAFPNPETGKFKPEWEKRGNELRELLTPSEYRAASRSTRNAHYTSEVVVGAMWDAVRRMGYRNGLALESSMGSGNFLGLMPSDMAARFIGVEYDSITARLAGALYPQATVLHSGFQDVALPDGAFDLDIGNPPFGSESLRFQYKPELRGVSIHNQFFRAGVDALRPGGLKVSVVSSFLMDSQDSSTRIALAGKAKLVAAIRLPSTAFKENARTDVVTDIIILQRRSAEDEANATEAVRLLTKPPSPKELKDMGEEGRRRAAWLTTKYGKELSWVTTSPVADPLGGEPMLVNDYFAQNPGQIVGTMDRSGTMRTSGMMNVRLDDPKTLGERLSKLVAKLPQDIVSNAADVAERTEQAHKLLGEAMRISVARHEPGHVSFDDDGKLTRVIEREYGDSTVLQNQAITPQSPWSSQLFMDSKGRWYKVDVRTDADGKPVKLIKDGKPTKFNDYVQTTYEKEADVPDSLRLGQVGYERMVDLVGLRDLLKRQLVLETEDAPKLMMEGNRKKLAKAYQAFVDKHGPINRRANAALVSEMPDGGLVLALESSYEPARTAEQAKKSGLPKKDETVKPAPIMRERVVPKYEPATRADTPDDALAITLAERGVVDVERIAALLNQSPEEAEAALTSGDKPLIFKDPETNTFETANSYLSGQVRRKLMAAKSAGLTQNVKALEAVQPERWGAENVSVQIGASWVPPKVYSDFAEHLMGGTARVRFSALTNTFSVDVSNAERSKAEQWDTERMSGVTILGKLLNSQSPTVMYTDSEGKTHTDKEATTLAILKGREIVAEFGDWVFKDGDRRDQLVEIFNDKFNTRVTRQYDGQHLKLPGKVPDQIIKMRRHQMNAIWRGISSRSMLVDHAVGAGKTFTAIARAMERRRMGLAQKPTVVVPNHLVEQWAADVYRLYPAAKVLAATKKDFEKKNRRRLLSRVATGDYDLVILPHSSFGFVGISPETELRYLEEELRQALAAVKEAEEQAQEDGSAGFRKPMGVKEAERLVAKIESRMASVREGTRDRLLTFEQLGIDDLTIDEAHEFKNLFYSSRLTKVRGMGDKVGSRKAADLYNKVRVLRDNGGAVTFMTGTPVSNSVVELYTMMRYLAPAELREMGMEHFDAWRAQFVDATPAFEPNESGRLQEVTRLGRTWSNMRNLMDLYYGFTDAVTNDDIKQWYREDNKGKEFPIPKVNGGERQLVKVKPTPAQESYLKEIIAEFDSLPDIKDVQERNAERLRLMDRARKLSLDIRAALPGSPSKEEGGKLDQIAAEVKRIYTKSTPDLGTQLVFLDRSVPKAKGDDKKIKEFDDLVAKRDKALRDNDDATLQKISETLETYDAREIEEMRRAQAGGWNAYQQLKDNLIALGIPAAEIKFVQDANTDEQKQALFDAVNGGKVRVLVGSTPRMGAGTNVQQRMVGLHHADVTWKPSDIEQREGRIIRQGNLLLEKYGDKFEVEILAYATERTVDAKMWSLNATKLKAINGLRKYTGDFTMDLEDEESVSMAEMAALASGNPLLLERVTLDSEIQNLELQERAHRRKLYGAQDSLRRAKQITETYPDLIEQTRQLAKQLTAPVQELNERKAARRVTVEGATFDSYKDAMKAAAEAVAIQQAGNEHARYSIEVNGQRLTNKSDIDEAVGAGFGDAVPFEVEIQGETLTQRTAAGRVVAAMLSPKAASKKGSGTIGSMMGMELKYMFSESGGFYKKGSVDVDIWLERDGKTIASNGRFGHDPAVQYTTAQIRDVLGQLLDDVVGKSNTSTAVLMQGELDAAKGRIKGLEERVNEPFPKEHELKSKRQRLNEVVGILTAPVQTEQAPVPPVEAKPSVSRAKEQPRTPASTIRAAITKAYGNLLDKLEAKGLVTIAQTEREAIEAAAQARADKTGGDVEQIKRSMLASVQMQRVWHGSPHRFDKFSTEFMGKGEGAQAFGWGLYYASKREIAESYRGTLTYRDMVRKFRNAMPDDASIEDASEWADSGDAPKDMARVIKALSADDWLGFDYPAQALTALFREPANFDISKELADAAKAMQGQLYEVEIPEDGDMLLWDKPLSEQSAKVRAGISKLALWLPKKQRPSDSDSGEAIYQSLVDRYRDAKGASETLAAAGIKGIKYLDGNSRSAGDGSYNYVIFDGADTQIVDVKYSANGNIEGFFDRQTGKSFLVADNLTAASAPGTLMHEVGIHMAAGGKLEPLFKRAGSLLKTGTQNEFIQRVKSRMARAGETSDEESAAYITTEYERDRTNAPVTVGKWLADLTAAVRAWLFSKGIILKADQLTVADIAAVARANAQSMARGGPNGGPGGQSFQRGTNAGTPENKAPGPQGDAQQGAVQGNAVAVSRQIAQAIQDDDDPYADYGLRVIPPEADVVVRPGDKLPPSNQWDDGTDTGEPLNGTSAARIDGDTEDAALKAIRLIGAHGKPGPNGYYYGDQVVLVKGEKVGAGEDVGEILLSDAVVVATWRKPDKGNSEVAPNDQSAPSGGPGGGQAFSRNVGDAAPDDAQRVQAAIEGKSLIEAAMFLARSSNKANASIAQKVAEKLKRMEGIGIDLKLHIVHRGDMAPAALANSRGYTESGFDSKGRDVAVWLNGADVAGKVGTEEEVLLHELVHAATTGMVHYGAMNPDTQAGRSMKDLMAVTDAIADHIKQRFADAEAGKVTLTEFELDMREGANNAFRSDDEVLAWALSNAEAQQYLEGIPYKSGSLWSNFVRSVRALLGMSPEMDTALSEVLRVAERLLTDDQAKTGRSAFWHKRGLRMIQQQGHGSIVQTQTRTALPSTLNIDGKDRPTTNSKGQSIHPTEEGVRNFYRWFAGSKVVDDQGRPLVVYHGTGADFGTFDKQKAGAVWNADKMGFFFSSEPATASEYADFAASQTNGSANIMPVYVSIKNPLTLEKFTELTNGVGLREGHGDGVDALTRFFDDERDLLLRYARQEKNAGILLEKDGKRLVLALNPTQIKSATGNTGAFSPTDPDIRFSRGGGIDHADLGTVGENDSQSSQWDAPLASSWDDKIYKLQDKNIDTKRVIQAIKKMAGDIQDKLNVYLQEELYHGRTAKRVLEFGRGELNPALDELASMGYSIPDLEEYMHARHAPEANVVLAARNPTREMIDTARAEAKAEIKRLKAELSVDGLGKDEAKALKAELKKAEAKLKSWTGVAAFKGTEEERNSLSGMKTEEAEAYLRNLPAEDAAKLKKVADKMDAIMAETSGMMVAYHLESQETVDGWNAMYRHYIPLHREGKDDGSMGTGQGFSIKGREVKGRTGSKRKVVNIVAHIAEAREKTIVRGEKNRVAQALVGLVTAYPNADFWKTGAPPSERVFDRATGKVKNQVNPAYKSLPNVVMAKVMGEDGKVKEVAVTFNENDERAVRMAGALKNLDTPQIEGWLGTVAKATRYFAAVNTQYNPIFGAVNLVRDVQGAMINLGATPLADQKMKIARDSVDALAGIYRDIRATRRGEVGSSKWSELYEQFQHDGGQTGFRNLFETTDDRSRELKDRVSPTDWAKSPLGRIMSANGKLTKQAQWMRDGWAIARDWLSDYNETMESATRLAVYKAALDKGMTRDQAASMAKNITVNFNRKGTMGTQAGALYAFFNAAMQGTARMGETLVTMEPGQPKTMRLSAFGKKVVYGGVLLGAVQALALAAGGFGDEEPPDFERERNLLIPTGWTGVGPDKGYIKIPMPLGLHVIPGIGRMGMEFVLSGGEDPAKAAIKFGSMMADAFNPIGNAGLSMQTIAPTVLDPLAALVENKDWTGKNIARESFNKDAPMFSQHKDSATFVAKFLAELVNYATGGNEYVGGALNWSPDQIDYLIGQVTGGVGRELSKAEQTATGAFTGDETPIYKVPLLGRFAGSASGKSGEANAFYTNADKLNRLETELKGMVKDGKSAEATALRMERPESRMIVGFNMAERQVQKLRKQKSALIEAGASAADVRAVDERITAIMQNMNQRMLSVAGN